MEAQMQLDPQQENRRLRAAAETMRSKQRLAVGGIVAGGMIVAAKFQFAHVLPLAPKVVLVAVGFLIPLVTAIPFLRGACPKCRGRYHSLASVVRRADNPAPCKSCGFKIEAQISRYG